MQIKNLNEDLWCEIVYVCTTRVKAVVRAGTFLGLRLPFYIFFLLNLSNIKNGRGLRVSLGSSLWGLESQFSLRSGVSKANSRSGLVYLLGEVLEFCDRMSGETASYFCVFCGHISWDVAAELLHGGVMFCKSSNSFWRDGGNFFLCCMFSTTEDAFPGVLFCFCSFSVFVVSPTILEGKNVVCPLFLERK